MEFIGFMNTNKLMLFDMLRPAHLELKIMVDFKSTLSILRDAFQSISRSKKLDYFENQILK